jgi:hypothetical protein
MKVWKTQHKGLTYEFQFFETTGEVSISKNSKPTYTIVLNHQQKTWQCNCPSGTYRGYCWHRTKIFVVLSQPSITEPWAEWAEEASGMRCEGRR